MKKYTGESKISPPEYGRSLSGLTINLLVRDLERAILFHREVLGVTITYADPDIALVEGFGTSWMIHADHTYDKHPYYGRVAQTAERGTGLEIRLHGCDPDQAEATARRLGFSILDASRDQPDHGLRETHIVDDEGYVWVPDVPIKN